MPPPPDPPPPPLPSSSTTLSLSRPFCQSMSVSSQVRMGMNTTRRTCLPQAACRIGVPRACSGFFAQFMNSVELRKTLEILHKLLVKLEEYGPSTIDSTCTSTLSRE